MTLRQEAGRQTPVDKEGQWRTPGLPDPAFCKPEGIGFLDWLNSRPYDDEVETPEAAALMVERRAQSARGEVITHEELMRELGL